MIIQPKACEQYPDATPSDLAELFFGMPVFCGTCGQPATRWDMLPNRVKGELPPLYCDQHP